jgi:type IV secretion system protein VirD4
MTRAAGLYPTVIVGVLLTFLVAFWMGTEVAAGKWRFAPSLGTPWFGRIYPPWSIVTWMMRYHWSTAAMPVFWAAWKIIGFNIVVGFVITFALAVRKSKRYGEPSDIHGSQQLGTTEQLQENGLLGRAGVYVGMWPVAGRMAPLVDTGLEPVLIVGPTGSGKDVGIVIPNGLTWLHSLFVLDPKREAWEHTAGWRAQQGQRCFTFDPTDTTGGTAKWNVLAEMPGAPKDVAFAQTLAQAGLEEEEYTRLDATSSHFTMHAENFLAALFLYIVYFLQDKSFAGGYAFLTDPARTIDETLQIMVLTGHTYIASAARALLSTGPNERSSILSTARKIFFLYNDPTVAANTSASDFCIADLLAEPASFYVTIPTPEIDRCKPLIRMLLYQLLQALTVQPRSQDSPFLFLLNEFPLLGNMRVLSAMLPVVRGYGIKVVLPAQDLNQITRAYGERESLTGNCKVKVYFRPEKVETAREISEACGKTTIYVQERTYTGHRWDWVLTHVIANERQVQRTLLTPDEILRLHDDKELLLYKGVPYLADKIRYYDDDGLLARSQIPAPMGGGALCPTNTTPTAWWLTSP